jgi:hypothetical protein
MATFNPPRLISCRAAWTQSAAANEGGSHAPQPLQESPRFQAPVGDRKGVA